MSNPVLKKNATKQKQIEWNVEPKKKNPASRQNSRHHN